MRSDRNNDDIIRTAREADRPRLMKLWQDCFADSDRFTGYYFDTYFKENKVWVCCRDGRIIAQLHENPYELQAGGRRLPGIYIVGVSTDADHRHSGAMTELLSEVFTEQLEDQQPFVYLMPADESIYLPFQFAYIYSQEAVRVLPAETVNGGGQDRRDFAFTAAPAASDSDLQACADISMAYLDGCCDIFTVRDAHYYRRLQLENQADGGDLLIFRDEDGIIAYVSYACEEKAEIREMYAAEGIGDSVWMWMLRNFQGVEMSVLPFPGQSQYLSAADRIFSRSRRPVIMGRIIHAGSFLEMIGRCSRGQGQITLYIIDRWIPFNNGLWLWIFSPGCASAEKADSAEADVTVDIGGLFQWLTAYKTAEELTAEGLLMMHGDLEKNADRIPRLSRIFINEII